MACGSIVESDVLITYPPEAKRTAEEIILVTKNERHIWSLLVKERMAYAICVSVCVCECARNANGMVASAKTGREQPP